MFWLMLLAPAMAAFFWWSWRERQRLMAQFINARLLPGLIAGVSVTRQKIRAALLIGAVVFIVLALARLQWGYSEQEVAQKGLDIVVAIDTSKSMLASDIAPNRLTRAKMAAVSLMQQAKSDRLGLVAFAGSAFLECPLTIDDAAFQESVDALDINTISDGGTSLAEAIDTATKAFHEGDNYKVLILFTDGEDNDTGALEAAKSAGKDDVKIFTVGIGTAAGELLQVKDENGNLGYIRDEQGNVVKSHLNEALLRQIADAAGGSYYSLSGANTMDALYERSLAPLPKSQSKEQWVRRPYERYHLPLAIAMVLLIAEIFFPERKPPVRRGREETSNPDSVGNHPTPNIEQPTSNVGAAKIVAIIGLLLVLPAVGRSSPDSALSDYKAGKFADAQKEFERLAATNNADARFIFNAGDAAYRATNYDEALKCFTATLVSQDVKLQQQAYFNIGNTQYRIGEQQKDLDSMQQQWEQSVTNFQNAVALNTNDVDAVHNLEFTKNRVTMIQQLKELARRAKSEADNSVRQRNYHRALEIMQQLVQNNIAAKPFQDYVEKLGKIDEIATPNQH